jgi:hypothetical protein
MIKSVADCLSLLQAPWHLLAEEVFNNEAEAKSAFNKFVSSRTSDFYQTEVNKLFFSLQDYLAVMLSISINLVNSELNCTILKFQV